MVPKEYGDQVRNRMKPSGAELSSSFWCQVSRIMAMPDCAEMRDEMGTLLNLCHEKIQDAGGPSDPILKS